MKKILLLTLILASIASSHSGRTDSNGGHNCSAKSKAKGLCTGYHYHNGGGSSRSSTRTRTTTSQVSSTGKESNVKEIQQLLRNGGYYTGSIDGVLGQGTRKAAKDYLNDRNYNNTRLDTLLKNAGIS